MDTEGKFLEFFGKQMNADEVSLRIQQKVREHDAKTA
jgi:hypothetical protein